MRLRGKKFAWIKCSLTKSFCLEKSNFRNLKEVKIKSFIGTDLDINRSIWMAENNGLVSLPTLGSVCLCLSSERGYRKLKELRLTLFSIWYQYDESGLRKHRPETFSHIPQWLNKSNRMDKWKKNLWLQWASVPSCFEAPFLQELLFCPMFFLQRRHEGQI